MTRDPAPSRSVICASWPRSVRANRVWKSSGEFESAVSDVGSEERADRSTLISGRRKTTTGRRFVVSSARGERLLGVLGLEEHPVGDDAGDGLTGPLDLQLGTELGVLDRDHRVADVAVESRRVAGGRDPSDLATAGTDRRRSRASSRRCRPRAWLRRSRRRPACDRPPAACDRAQRVAADEVLLLLELDHPLVAVADLVGVLLDGHVAAVREDASLDPPDVTRSDRGEAMRLAGLDQRVPQLEPVATGVAQIELVAEFARVAGARDDKPHASSSRSTMQ